MGRFVSIWFRHLTTDWFAIRNKELQHIPFVLAAPERGRMLIKASNKLAEAQGIHTGMVLADARALLPSLQVLNDKPLLADKLLAALAEWCIRYTPLAATDLPDGLILDSSGCAHLWGGEQAYLKDILAKLRNKGYDVRAAMADTPGTAWAIARFGRVKAIIEKGGMVEALMPLPPAALRLDASILQRLEKLGLYQVGNFMNMPRSVLRRRFGDSILKRLDQALGYEMELIEPVQPAPVYQERLPCLEPIRTAPAIEIALQRLLQTICSRLHKEEKGVRKMLFRAYRIDGKIERLEIGTNRASRNPDHLFKLFEQTISSIEPDLGIELFMLDAPVIEELPAAQEVLWHTTGGHDETVIAELLDRIAGKTGAHAISRYLPVEHSWPERAIIKTSALHEKPQTMWRTDLPRPTHLLKEPEPIRVMVPLPDYPPIQFSYKGQLHKVAKADGPERIEREWWIDKGLYRDYYCVENEAGARYWLFRLGHYDHTKPQWFIHGFFA